MCCQAGRTKSHITDEVKLVAQPVGICSTELLVFFDKSLLSYPGAECLLNVTPGISWTSHKTCPASLQCVLEPLQLAVNTIW